MDVVSINLQVNALQGPLPSTLGKLFALERLDLSENRLTHALPSEMGQLSSITHLLLNNNQPGLGNRYEGGQWGRDEHPHAERFIPTELGDAKALQVRP